MLLVQACPWECLKKCGCILDFSCEHEPTTKTGDFPEKLMKTSSCCDWVQKAAPSCTLFVCFYDFHGFIYKGE